MKTNDKLLPTPYNDGIQEGIRRAHDIILAKTFDTSGSETCEVLTRLNLEILRHAPYWESKWLTDKELVDNVIMQYEGYQEEQGRIIERQYKTIEGLHADLKDCYATIADLRAKRPFYQKPWFWNMWIAIAVCSALVTGNVFK